MQLTGGPLGGQFVTDGADGDHIDLDCSDSKGRLARYEFRTADAETGQRQGVFVGLVVPEV